MEQPFQADSGKVTPEKSKPSLPKLISWNKL
jgi:hypothetical protein